MHKCECKGDVEVIGNFFKYFYYFYFYSSEYNNVLTSSLLNMSHINVKFAAVQWQQVVLTPPGGGEKQFAMFPA